MSAGPSGPRFMVTLGGYEYFRERDRIARQTNPDRRLMHPFTPSNLIKEMNQRFR